MILRANLARLLMASVVVFLFTACDKKPPPPPKKKKATVSKKQAVQRVPRKGKAKSNWDYLAPHFKTFAGNVDTMDFELLRDPFEKTMESWLPQRIKTKKKTLTKKVVVQLTPLEERPPIERHSVGSFKLAAIMSATDIPKALLVDPLGNGYIVWKNRIIGKEKGQIVAINQYDVIIKVPGKEPIKKTIKPKVVFKQFY